MPTFELNPPTIEENIVNAVEHSVHLPINKEIADVIAVDVQVEFRAIGFVKEIDAGFSDGDDYSMRVAITKIEVYPTNEFTELSKDDDDD